MVHRDLKLENILLSTDLSSEPYNIKVRFMYYCTTGHSTTGCAHNVQA